MATNSKIEWTDTTWNPTTGCSPVSPGCAHCYAFTMTKRLAAMGQDKYTGLTTSKHFNGRMKEHPDTLDAPLRWKKPRKVFVNSMSDLFHADVDVSFINMVFGVMALTPQHTYQVLTKRPKRMAEYLASADLGSVLASLRPANRISPFQPKPGSLEWHVDGAKHLNTWPLPNVWLGTSCEDQQRADERIPHLLKCPAAVRFLSCEPLLGPIDLKGWGNHSPSDEYLRWPERWEKFTWPDWVPPGQRKQIEDFWSAGHGRSPREWGRDHVVQHVPATGARIRCEVNRHGWARVDKMATLGVEGRYLHSWNNIGRLITDDGETIPASGGCGSSWLSQWLQDDFSYKHKLHWVIAGGESGHNARPMHPDWIRSLRDQCVAAKVPFFFKQWGEWAPCEKRDWHGLGPTGTPRQLCFGPDGNSAGGFMGDLAKQKEAEGWVPMTRVGKKAAGRLLDGREWNEYPQPLTSSL